jgi:hypothetical protein
MNCSVRLVIAVASPIFAVAFTLSGMAMQSKQSGGPSQQELAKTYEESCVLHLRTINTAQSTYWGGEPSKGYARTLRELGPAGAGLLEPVIASGKKDGYRYRLVAERATANQPARHYVVVARPIKRLVKSQRSFFTDETGVIRFTTENRAARGADPPLDSEAR